MNSKELLKVCVCETIEKERLDFLRSNIDFVRNSFSNMMIDMLGADYNIDYSSLKFSPNGFELSAEVDPKLTGALKNMVSELRLEKFGSGYYPDNDPSEEYISLNLVFRDMSTAGYEGYAFIADCAYLFNEEVWEYRMSGTRKSIRLKHI